MKNWKSHILRFVLLDDLLGFSTPVDAYCPDCGRRLINGLKKLDDQPTIYYARCVACGFNLETDPGDYEEEMERFISEIGAD